MNPLILVYRTFAILSSFFIAHTSSAYLQYTYSSDALEWQRSILNGEDYGLELSTDPDGKVAFGFSFNIDENLLSDTAPTSFIIKDAEVVTDTTVGNEYYTPDFHSLFYGKIVINPDRTIKFWNFVTAMEVRDLADNRIQNHLRDHDIRFITAGGASTCNCDRFWEDLNIIIPRPQNTWVIAATLENQYRNASDFGNWTINSITIPSAALVSVPESNSLALLGVGLAGIMLMRRREKLKTNV